MRPHAALLLGFLLLAVACCAVFIAYRLRCLAAQRADAAVRAAAALAEMTRLARELRQRQADAPDEGESLSAGERLRRRYPGSPRRALS